VKVNSLRKNISTILETYKIIPVNLESYFRILTSVIEFQDLQEIILEIIF